MNTDQLLIKALKKHLEKRKRKTVELPVDLTKSGEFPEKDATPEQRMEQIKFFAGYLADALRPVYEGRAKIMRQCLKEAHQRKQFFNFIVHGVPEETTFGKVRRFVREQQKATEAIILDASNSN